MPLSSHCLILLLHCVRVFLVDVCACMCLFTDELLFICWSEILVRIFFSFFSLKPTGTERYWPLDTYLETFHFSPFQWTQLLTHKNHGGCDMSRSGDWIFIQHIFSVWKSLLKLNFLLCCIPWRPAVLTLVFLTDSATSSQTSHIAVICYGKRCCSCLHAASLHEHTK